MGLLGGYLHQGMLAVKFLGCMVLAHFMNFFEFIGSW